MATCASVIGQRSVSGMHEAPSVTSAEGSFMGNKQPTCSAFPTRSCAHGHSNVGGALCVQERAAEAAAALQAERGAASSAAAERDGVWRAELDAARAGLERAQRDAEALRGELERARRETETLRAEAETLRGELGGLRRSEEAMQGELKRARREAGALSASLHEAEGRATALDAAEAGVLAARTEAAHERAACAALRRVCTCCSVDRAYAECSGRREKRTLRNSGVLGCGSPAPVLDWPLPA